ncbi:MAG: TonB-dependent receptor family protein [Polynucleobacter victoriensis]
MEKHYLKLTFIASVALVMFSVSSYANHAVFADVIVTGSSGSLTQGTVDGARENIKTIPGGASVVDLNQVREGRQSTWSDSLAMAPGVFIQDRFGSEEARISVRGSALSRTYHSFGIKVLQDGVPVNYADGFFDMQTVDPNASRYVEVLRGPNATTYGATTLGGAINFVAPTGYDNQGIITRAEVGSFAYNKVFASVGGVAKPDLNGNVWDYYAAGSQTKQDGFRDHAQMENQKALGNFGVKVGQNIESRFYVAAVRSRTQLPGYLTKAELNADPTIANSSISGGIYPYRVDANRRRDIDTQRLANKTTIRDGNRIYELSAYFMNYSLWHPIDSIVEQNAKTVGGHLKVIESFDRHLLTFAYLPSLGSTKGTLRPTNNQGVATGIPTSNYDQQSNNSSLFIEDKYRWTDKTTLVGALQYDRANRKVVDSVLASNNYDYTFSQWSPRVGVLYDLTPVNQIFASVSRNFEAPIFGLGSMSATTPRSAQSGKTYEIGARGVSADMSEGYRAEWDLTLYKSNLKNEFFTACTNPNNTSTCSTTNVPATIHQGLELGSYFLLKNKYEAKVSLLISDFKYDGNPTLGNNRLPGISPVLIRGEALYRWGNLIGSGGLPAIYAGPKFEWATKAPMDAANTLSNDAYVIWGFKAGQKIDKNWSWFADARNLSNKKYAATTNISSNYFGATAAAVYYPGDGRSLYVGLDKKWD